MNADNARLRGYIVAVLYIASLVLMGIALMLVRFSGKPETSEPVTRATSDSNSEESPRPLKLVQADTLSITVTPIPPRPSALIIPFPERRKAFRRETPAPRRA